MVPQSLQYLGELRCRVTHEASGVQLVTDAPTDNHGKGESFSPTDLLVSALVSCQITTMGIAARAEGIPLDGTRVYAEKHMSADPPRRVARVVVRIEFPDGLNAQQRSRVEHIARTCPVALSVHPAIQIDLSFHYPD
jgi:uncharacterized OsmC-like protein